MLIGLIRSIFPLWVQKGILAIEFPYANYVFWLGGGIDDAVSDYIGRNQVAYKPFLLNRVINSAPDSKRQKDALFHLIAFLDDVSIRESLKKYSETKASPEIKQEIEKLLNDVS